jgi:4-hydroxybenzoate polyprenyltransferase
VIKLVRPRAWWFNKVPLSVLTGLLLIDGRDLTAAAVLALIGLVAIVSCVANYGYGLNELFDREEDRRGGRVNAAQSQGPRAIALAVLVSAAAALAVATAIGGLAAALLTAAELLIPLAYSVPPLRTKERQWWGVFCDVFAAHVYPALLALIIVSHLQLRSVAPTLAAAAAVWSLMTGLRGILSHQLQSEEHDRAADLLTVVHCYGHQRLTAFVTFVILPLEAASFVALVAQCDVHWIFALVAATFLIYELLKFALNAFPATVFTRRGGHYLPFVDEGAYKVWGPLALAVDASLRDIRYLALVPLVYVLFRPRMNAEGEQIRATCCLFGARMANGKSG